MNLKLDENIPARLVPILADLGHDVDTVVQEGLSGHSDEDVWRATQGAGRFLITQDLLFSDARTYPPNSHCGVLLVRLKTPGRNDLVRRIRALFSTEDTTPWEGCFVVASERKLRIRRS